MADYEVRPLSVDETVEQYLEIIDAFRKHNAVEGAQEIERVPLVSRHDPTIRFTNSTTSVMKPILRCDVTLPDEGVYLAQPAMGSQGIQYWLGGYGLGPFASYFTSLGSLYTPGSGDKALASMVGLARNSWKLDSDEIWFEAHQNDEDLVEVVSVSGLAVHIANGGLASYRHAYGMTGISGRNANLLGTTGGQEIDLGTLTLIQTEEDNAPIAWEVSFDSSPVLAARRGTGHAIESLPAAAILAVSGERNTEYLVAADCAAVSAALMLEGMVPRSKGREGMLRKFFMEYLRLSAKRGMRLDDTQDVLLQVSDLEMSTRQALSPEPALSVDPAAARRNILDWTAQLWVDQSRNEHA